MSHNNNGIHRQFINTEQIIIGGLVGLLMTLWAGFAWWEHEHLTHTPVEETLIVALYLTALVSYVGLQFPTMFTSKPRLSVFALCFFAGHISLLFDSFAVILLFSTLVFVAVKDGDNEKFNAFAVKSIASFNALTVGGGFYLGELWGLPHYISSGFDYPVSGLPLLLVLTPYCIFTSGLAAISFSVKVKPVPFDRSQMFKIVEFVTFLVLLIVTHSPYLCLGLLLLYSAVRGQTQHLINSGLHELKEGGMTALGLILAALFIQRYDWIQSLVNEYVQGPWVMVLAAVSSPFAGAMIAPSTNIHDFYVNLSWLMLGAPLLVSSSLVAIMVFREQLAFSDLPKSMQRLPWITRRGVFQEAEIYTLIQVPLTAGLGLCLWIANASGVFVWGYNLLT